MLEQTTSQFSEKEFTFSYDLPSTLGHTIDAKTLGKNLIDVVELIEQGDKLLNGETSTVQVNVKAHKEGSFQVEFVAFLQSGGIDVLKTLGIGVTSFAALSGSVMGVLKILRGRKIQATISKKESDGKIQEFIQLDDGEEIQCPSDVRKLLMSHQIRTKIGDVFEKPAQGEEGAKIKIVSNDSPQGTIVIEGEDLKSFKAPPKRLYEEITVTPKTVNLVFVQINNNTGRSGWRVKLMDEEFAVKMEDEGFMARMNSKTDFPVKDELFEVVLETTKRIYDEKTTFSYKITEVKRHRTSADKKII